MSGSLSEFIEELICLDKKDVKFIKNFDGLIDCLNEIDEVVGLKSVKDSLIRSVKFLIVNNRRNEEAYNKHFLHCLVTGPPGCGKTTVCRFLCKFWSCLGVIKKKDKNEDGYKQITNRLYDTRNELLDLHYNSEFITRKEKDKILERAIDCVSHFEMNVRNAYETAKFEGKLEGVGKTEKKKKTIIDGIPFFVYKRADLIGKYVGHTAIKTGEALEEALGGVVMIDEAYSLYNESNGDSFGMECLTTINEFMSEHSDEIIIIFIGYKDLLDRTIFSAQPGLRRRITNTFEIEEYTPLELRDIFLKQLRDKGGWSMKKGKELDEIFIHHKNMFRHYGGDTERLVKICTEIACEKDYEKIRDGEKSEGNKISIEILREAIKQFNALCAKIEEKEPPVHMYL